MKLQEPLFAVDSAFAAQSSAVAPVMPMLIFTYQQGTGISNEASCCGTIIILPSGVDFRVGARTRTSSRGLPSAAGSVRSIPRPLLDEPANH
jgi:hypothetical protein